MGEKVKASVHSQRGGYSLAHNDGSLYREDNDKFKKGRRGNVHINPDGSELTGGRISAPSTSAPFIPTAGSATRAAGRPSTSSAT